MNKMDMEQQENGAEKTATKIELTTEGVLVDLYRMSATEDMEKVRQASTSKSPKLDAKVWKEGDLCMAPYPEDGRWYHAKIIKMDGTKCRVTYTEYNEEGDVEVSELLSESDVEHPEEEEVEKMDTVVYEKPSNTPSKNAKSDRFPIPNVCPPPPELFAKLAKASSEKESLTNMLMSWYMSGYHTGYHEGLQEGRKASQNGFSNRRFGR